MLVASTAGPGKPVIWHCPGVPPEERRRRHGSGTHSPLQTLSVSESTTVVFEFLIGEQGVQPGGQLLVVWRWPFDWGDLQTTQSADAGYLRAEIEPAAPGEPPARLALRYNWIAGIEPWHHQLAATVQQGELREGDRVRLICGDTSLGGSGWRAPTCVADRCGFLMLIDHAGTGQRIRLVETPAFRIVAGTPTCLQFVAPADAVAGHPFEMIVRAEDCWGNPAALSSPPLVQLSESPEHASQSVAIEPIARSTVRPAYHFRVSSALPGRYRFRAQSAELPASAESNLVVVHEQLPQRQIFWGDVHSGQSEIGCGCGSLAEHYAFGRDCSGLQFITHQANDHYVTLDDWNETRRVTNDFYEPGRYVPLLGCEWSPLTKDGGDRNVFYRDDEPTLRRSGRFFQEDQPDPEPDLPTAPEFHDAFRDRDVLVNIHVGGRMTNLDWYEPRIERLCETHSTHGTCEWFVFDALSRGYKVGLTAGTDGVMGRPGACRPGRRLIRNVQSGLTAVYATELTREAIWEALQQRRTYATTGQRIRLAFEVDGQPMGAEHMTSNPPRIQLHVIGTQAIERVDLFRGCVCIGSWAVSPPQDASLEIAATVCPLRLLWSGTERRGTARLQRVVWDGELIVQGGKLELLDTINFQSLDDHAVSVSERTLRWSSSTAGNSAGILIRVEGDDDTELEFRSAVKTTRFRLDQVRLAEMTVAAGGIGRKLRVGPPPRPDGPCEFELQTCDAENVRGEFPYWVRVVQVDQAMAWSSPVYVMRQ